MADYRLDELGWLHFERLIQALLKASLGVGVEAWGGQGDYGRDAYAQGRFAFPAKGVLEEGPFLFQAKFVSGANAAGAKPGPALLKAVSAEMKRMQKRISSGAWKKPRFYVLITNVLLSPGIRDEVEKRIRTDITQCAVHSLGALDVCDLIKLNPEIVPSFPELLSLRDLDLLLREIVNKEILERSRSAIQEGRELARLFAPTSAYRRAWEVLQKYHFVVLDGPPEMGKTAIARMIALAQLSQGWQAIECRTTADFFTQVESRANQIFVADDAFGRTEYDVTLGRQWERDLPRILRRMDSSHWLIWTTRKHILARALKEMDLVEPATDFPSPGEVIVTADDLTVEEKSRILYRHAKAAKLSESQKIVIKDNAPAIVRDRHFTPERIRRLVVERLPSTVPVSKEDLAAEVAEAIRNPTDRMRKSYSKLPQDCKWILVALLEFPWRAEITALGRRFVKHSGNRSRKIFAEAIDDLTGAFIRILPSSDSKKEVDWIHPSYRDLVIEELSKDSNMQVSFLAAALVKGLQLSLSALDEKDPRRFRLLSFDESWDVLENRCIGIAQTYSEEEEFVGLLRSFISALRLGNLSESDRKRLSFVASRTCENAWLRWTESKASMGTAVVEAYLSVSELLMPKPSLPDVSHMWNFESKKLRQLADDVYELDGDKLDSWLKAIEIAQKLGLDFAAGGEFERRAKCDFLEIIRAIREDVDSFASFDRPEGYDSEADRLESIQSALRRVVDSGLVNLADDEFDDLDDLISDVSSRAERYRSEGAPYPDYDGTGLTKLKEEQTKIEVLFNDL